MKQKITKQSFNIQFLFTLLFLLGFGVLMVYNASVSFAGDEFGEKYYFFYLQISWAVIGLIGLVIVSHIDLEYIQKMAPKLMWITLILLVFVLIPTWFAPAVNGARRWIYLNPSPLPEFPFIGRIGFQPSDLAKVMFSIYFADIVTRFKLGKIKKKTLSILLIVFATVGLVFLEPDFDTSMLILLIAVAILFVAGLPYLYFLIGVPTFSFIGFLFILVSDYRRERLFTFFSPEKSNLSESGYHITQILIALGSGGMFGLGLGNSVQKYGFLPEVTADSIFAIIGEEFGFIGSSLIILLLGFFLIKGYEIAKNAKTDFGKYVTTGIMVWMSAQVFLNLMAMVKILPLTGVPLPLLSYGGSSMVFGLIGLGIVLNVSKNG
ncbi:MAG: putative peptidoglycan glycosyltransferase FtsW [bacterium]|nr:putative peptidoglycan glycosyltransferase FtsW [bacterium]